MGDYAVDLSVLADEGLFKSFDASCFSEGSLNKFMGLGKSAWSSARQTLQTILSSESAVIRDNEALKARALIPLATVIMELPAKIGDYTDCYASRQHATNVGIMFRGADNALQPNWLHLPVAYHGRASSIVVSGTDFRRPCGQLFKDANDPNQGSVYGPSMLMDFELEMGCFVGPGNPLGEPITMDTVDDHVFGFVLLNDWSARDIQKWEYVPLGPFGAKNFCSTISPWVVTTEALEPFRTATSTGKQDPEPLPYLREPGYSSYDVDLRVSIRAEDIGSEPFEVSHSNFKNMYWTHRQQLVHHTVTGCNMNPGDLIGSGTISGDEPGTYGSMLELCWKGTKPIKIKEGVERKFLRDGDTVVMSGVCHGPNYKVGFGTCEGKVLPAVPFKGI